MAVEHVFLSIDDSLVRVALHDERDEHGTSVVLVSGDDSVGVPATAEPPTQPPPFPVGPVSLRQAYANEGRELQQAELHVDTSELPAGRVSFSLEPFAAGVRAALAAGADQPVKLTREEAERWGARLFAVAE